MGAGSRRWELGETDNPRRLVPGDGEQLRASARELRDHSSTHTAIADGHRTLPNTGWAGAAADQYAATVTQRITRHDRAADATRDAAAALEDYADSVDWAHRRAAEAIDLHDADTTTSSGNGRDPAGNAAPQAAPPDPQARRAEARDLLDFTRGQLGTIAEDTRVRVRRAHDLLPDPTPALTPTDPALAHTAPAAFGTGTPPAGGRTVTVQPGDTLSGIAHRELGAASRWPEIAALNPAITNPDLIFPGQRLTLPGSGEGHNPQERCDPQPPNQPDDRQPPNQQPERPDTTPPPSPPPATPPVTPAPTTPAVPPTPTTPTPTTPPAPTPPHAPPGPDSSTTPEPREPAPTTTPTPSPEPSPPAPSTSPAPEDSGTPETHGPAPAPPPAAPTFPPLPTPRPDPYLPSPLEPPPTTESEPAQPAPPAQPPPAAPEEPGPPPTTPESTPESTSPTAPPPQNTTTPPGETTPGPTTPGLTTPPPPSPDDADPNPDTGPNHAGPDPGPDTSPQPGAPPHPDPDADPDADPDSDSDSDSAPEGTTPSPVADHGGDGEDADPEAGIDLGPGLLLVGGLGAVAAGAVLLARRRDAAAYRPGSSPGTGTPPDSLDRHRNALPPIVRRLATAYRWVRTPPAGADTPPRPAAPSPSPAPPSRAPSGVQHPGGGPWPRFALPVGITPDRTTALVDLAATPALALHGDRVPDIARGVLLTCLTPPPGRGDRRPFAHVVLPAADAAHLLGDTHDQPFPVPLPAGLHVVDHIDAALNVLERWPHPAAHDQPGDARTVSDDAMAPLPGGSPPVVLIATAPRPHTRPSDRLHRILAARRGHAVGAVLLGGVLGVWPDLTHIDAGPDATVHTATGLAQVPAGTRLFVAPAPETRDLLAALTAPPPTIDPPGATGPTHLHDPDEPDQPGDHDSSRRRPHPVGPPVYDDAASTAATAPTRHHVDPAPPGVGFQAVEPAERASTPAPSRPPRPARARPWLPFGVYHGQPVLLDLAATHGFGLTGPGAAAVIRALLLRLLDQQPPAVFVVPADTANELFGQRHDRWPAGVRVTPDPFTALQVTEAELTRRSCTAPPHTSWPLWLVIAPAPTTTPARHRLDATLTAGRPLGIGAILTGWWAPGFSCHIDDSHRVTQHTPPDHDPAGATPGHPDERNSPVTPARLLGAHLHTCSTAELLGALAHQDRAHQDLAHQDPPPIDDDEPTTPIGGCGAPPGHEHRSRQDTGSGADADEDPGRNHRQADAPGEHQARGAVHRTTQRAHRRHAARAQTTATDPDPPLQLSILGPTILRHTPQPDTARPSGEDGAPTGMIIDRLGPRATELLVYLAVHPNGVHRDTLVAALWPDADRARPTNALNATLARLRKTLRATGNPHRAQAITHTGDRYQLDPDLITVDYWAFLIAAADITHPDPHHRAHACDTAIRTYQGHLAADLTSEWLITLREATRRRYFDALTTLARLTIHTDPERTLDLLETARNLEPLKEGIYRDIMRIQARLNRPDAAEHTLALLRAQLADIDTEPDDETLRLAATIRARTTQHDLTEPATEPGTRPPQPHRRVDTPPS
jgi:DNA-binding SARP family transcriptional activator/LysM repeat protein